MDAETRYVVGYDLNDNLTQISYFELNNDSPETLISDGENERLGIPTLLCKKRKVNQWSFGTEAERLIRNDGEAEVSKIFTTDFDFDTTPSAMEKILTDLIIKVKTNNIDKQLTAGNVTNRIQLAQEKEKVKKLRINL